MVPPPCFDPLKIGSALEGALVGKISPRAARFDPLKIGSALEGGAACCKQNARAVLTP